MESMRKELEELRRLEARALLERYRRLFGREPRVKRREWLWKRSAWKLQERRSGGLSGLAKRRLEALLEGVDLPFEEGRAAEARKAPAELAVGSTLARTWHGREVRVEVTERGFEHEGVSYRSLSAVAKAVTGSHWNGRLFFGLSGRRRAT